jgi:hypothetical protein
MKPSVGAAEQSDLAKRHLDDAQKNPDIADSHPHRAPGGRRQNRKTGSDYLVATTAFAISRSELEHDA